MKNTLRLLSLTTLFAANTSFATPQVLYGPLFGSTNHRYGESIACINRSLTQNSSFGIGAAEIGTSVPGDIYLISGDDGATTLFTDNGFINEGYGQSMSVSRDIDGDGVDDLIVGAPNGTGRSLLYRSSNRSSPTIFSSTSAGMSVGTQFGTSAAADVASGSPSTRSVFIGAPLYDPTFQSLESGALTVFDGAGNFQYLCEGATQSRLGFSVSAMGDVNKDGFQDVAVGAPGANNGDGEVRVYDGISLNDCGLLYTISPTVGGSEFGTTLVAFEDISGDGVFDLIVGAPKVVTLSAGGTAGLYSGSDGSLLCSFSSGSGGDLLGASATIIGDMDGSGDIAFAISSPGFQNDTGKVDFYTFSKTARTCTRITQLVGSTPGQQFGKRVSGRFAGGAMCDMNGDTYPEFVVSTNDDSNGTDRGSVIVYSVPTPTPTITPTPTPTPRVATFPSSARLSYALSAAGDMIVTHTLNRDPKRQCSVTLFGRSSKSDLSGLSPVMTLKSKKRASRTTYFRAFKLQKAEDFPGTILPYIYHVTARTECVSGKQKKRFLSNAFARYINCGQSPALAIAPWERALPSKLR